MKILLLALFAAWVAADPASPPVATEPSAPTESKSEFSKLPVPDDPTEREYRNLLEMDDAAQDEVNQWIRTEEEFRRAGGGLPDATLRARVLQRLDSVKKAYDDFLARHPDHVRAHIAFASFLSDINEEAGAREHLEKARDLDPTDPAIWNNLAHIYSHGGPVDKAFQHFEKAIELRPDEPVYIQNLATMVFLFRPDAMEYYDCDESQVFERSLDLYRKALKLDPSNLVLATDYAESYYLIRPPASLDPDARRKAQQELHRKAIAAWDYALKIATTDIEREAVHIHLARIKINDARFDEARKHLDLVQNELYDDIKKIVARNLEERQSAPKPESDSTTP